MCKAQGFACLWAYLGWDRCGLSQSECKAGPARWRRWGVVNLANFIALDRLLAKKAGWRNGAKRRFANEAAMALAWLALLRSPATAVKARETSMGKDPLSITWRWTLVTCLGPSHDRPGGSGTWTDRRPLCAVGRIWGTLESRTISPLGLKFDRISPLPRMPAPKTSSTGEGPREKHLTASPPSGYLTWRCATRLCVRRHEEP